MQIRPIATIHTPFPEKFGVPRQSGLVQTEGKIIFNEEFRNSDAVRGLEGFSHIWLIWQFSKTHKNGWSPTVRPPRLGGNKRIGVFATRSPFRPNGLGLSSVELTRIDYEDKDAPVLYVKGADILDGTPIYDIKPYLNFTDCHSDAVCGFAGEKYSYKLNVQIPEIVAQKIPKDNLGEFIKILEGDPRPAYISDPDRIYKMSCLGLETSFSVNENTLTVIEVVLTTET